MHHCFKKAEQARDSHFIAFIITSGHTIINLVLIIVSDTIVGAIGLDSYFDFIVTSYAEQCHKPQAKLRRRYRDYC